MEYIMDGKVQSRDFSMDELKHQSNKEMMGCDRTPEEVVNSIKITEGPVTHMSMAVQKTSRTPYSDATQVSMFFVSWNLQFNRKPEVYSETRSFQWNFMSVWI